MANTTTLTNHLYIGNYTSSETILSSQSGGKATNENCYWKIKNSELITVQHFSFHMERSRNEAGMPYDPVLTTLMEFTIRFNGDGGKNLYSYLHDNSAKFFTFFWSPAFYDVSDSISPPAYDGCLKSFSGVMLVSGHVIDVDETIEFLSKGSEYKQLELNVKLLVSDISFGDNKAENTCELSLKEDSPDKVKGYSKYALFLTDSDAPKTGVSGGITHSISQKLQHSDDNIKKEVRAILKNLWYHKRISQPCEITAVLTLTWDSTQSSVNEMPSRNDIKELLFHKRAQLKVVDSDRGLDQLIADNFFVYEMSPCYKSTANTSSVDVELHMFSLDKLMTLDKFSEAYTAKRLGIDIFNNRKGDFKLKMYPEPTDSTVSTDLMTLSGDIDNLQVLKLTTEEKELRIPYCVQYNETFYDFIKRLANRYGEFLFFEGGKLHLGLEPGTSNYEIITGSGSSATTSTIDWAKVKELQARSYQHYNAKNLTIKDQHLDYLERANDETVVYVTDDSKYNPDPVPADEHLKILKKDGGICMADQYEEFRKFIMQDLLTILSGNLLAQMFADIVTTETIRVYKAGMKTLAKQESFNKSHFDPYEDPDDKTKLGHIKDKKVMQFGTINGKASLATMVDDTKVVNFTSKFFSLIREMEKEVAEEAVTLNFGEYTQPFSLGDKIQVDGIDYIVIDIEGRADKDKNGFTDVQQVTAIPLYTRTKDDDTTSSYVVPPLEPDIQICEAKSQRAFIDDANDPLGMGRVRIRYPWQKKDDDASPWIRVALPMATDGGCVNFEPSRGDEAMVDYEYGNIERPYVTGYMMSPYTKFRWGGPSVPDKGIVTVNGHSLTFDDNGDGSNFFWGWVPIMGTVKNLLPSFWWSDFMKSKDEGLKGLVGGFTLTDRYGLYKVCGSSDGRKVDISSPMGDVSLSAFTGIKIMAPNGDIKISGKNVTISAGDKLTLKSGGNLKDRLINTSKKFGWSDARWFGADFGLGLLNNFSAKTLESMIDLSFLRCVMDVFTRPVDGTLKIKSNTHVMVEAGKGSVQVPQSFYNKAPSDSLTDEERLYQGVVMPVVFETMKVIETEVNTFVDNFKTAFDAYNTAYKAYKQSLQDNQGNILPFDSIKGKAFAVQLNTVIATDPNAQITEAELNANAIPDDKKKPNDIREEPKDPSDSRNPNYSKWNNSDDDGKKKLMKQFREDYDSWSIEKADYDRKLDIYNSFRDQCITRGIGLRDAIFNLRIACNTENNRNLTAFDANTMVKGIADQLRSFLELVKCPLSMDKVNNEAKFPNIISDYNDWDAEKKYIKRKIAYNMVTNDAATFNYTPPAIPGQPVPAPVTLKIKEVFKILNKVTVTDFSDDNQWSLFVRNVIVDDSPGKYVDDWWREHVSHWKDDLYDTVTRKKTWNPKEKGRILFSDSPTKTMSFTQSGLDSTINTEALTKQFGPEISRILGDLQ